MKNLSVVLLLLIAVLASFMALSIVLTPGVNEEAVMIEVPKGASSNRIADQLHQTGVIKRKLDFRVASRLLGIGDKLQAGKYRFAPRTQLIEVLLKLKSGKIIGEEPLRVTFPEGTSIYKMGSILEKNEVPCYEDFRKLVKKGLEGYLYPDTYVFEKNISAEALSRLMKTRFDEVVLPYWEQNKQNTNYKLHQIIILASIIEKEAALEKERTIISSVFHNRLNINMALDSCSTVKYALERPTKVVYYDQLKYPSPYNTYLHRGLPPGPICNPGLSSIKAAIYPARTDYLYFVSNQDGSHTFSATFSGHQKARTKKK